MIIETDFLDHWKTVLLSELLDGDPLAPIYLMRLWAHCQQRKRDSFEGCERVLKAVCRFSGDASKLMDSMVTSKWVEFDGSLITARGFREANLQLFRNWENGQKGGRKPKRNPSVTQAEPTANPIGTDELDKTRLDKEEPPPPTPSASASNEAGSSFRREEEELSARGVKFASKAIAGASANGCEPPHVMAAISHFDSKPGAWGPPALFERVRTLHPKQSVADCWPLESDEFRKSEKQQQKTAARTKFEAGKRERAEQRRQQKEREAELERKYGPAVDAIPFEKAQAMIREAYPDLAPSLLGGWSRGDPAQGMARDSLITLLREKEKGVCNVG